MQQPLHPQPLEDSEVHLTSVQLHQKSSMCPWLTMPTSGKAQPMQTRAQAAARWPLDPPHLPRSPKPSITISGVGQTGSSPPLSASSLPAYSPIIIGMKLVYLVLYFSPPHLLFSCFCPKVLVSFRHSHQISTSYRLHKVVRSCAHHNDL